MTLKEKIFDDYYEEYNFDQSKDWGEIMNQLLDDIDNENEFAKEGGYKDSYIFDEDEDDEDEGEDVFDIFERINVKNIDY